MTAATTATWPHARARERLRRPRRGRLLVDHELRRQIEAKLQLEWSPEQIAGWLRTTFPDRTDWHVCHETIYQALYLASRGGLSRQLTRRLRTGRPLRKRRRRATERTPRFVAPGQLIDQRPDIVERRERVGDWEGDLIVGRSNRSAIATLVDRRSRYLHLVALPRGHDAAAVRDALIATFAQLPAAARHTLTWDQGSELAHHNHIGEHLQQGVFFAYPASPWLRGTNENTVSIEVARLGMISQAGARRRRVTPENTGRDTRVPFVGLVPGDAGHRPGPLVLA